MKLDPQVEGYSPKSYFSGELEYSLMKYHKQSFPKSL